MRISDWRSDVCSSDLVGLQLRRGSDVVQRPNIVNARGEYRGAGGFADIALPGPDLFRDQPVRACALQDRKSVVEGKSVSVRVDLGGSRILKKKDNEGHYVNNKKTDNKN